MPEYSDELLLKIEKAENAEEIAQLLKADGQEVDEKTVERFWAEVTRMRESDGTELSLDELDTVAGGRDWMLEGCKATVEPGSNCWGIDGGCWKIHVKYTNFHPELKCPKRNGPHVNDEQYREYEQLGGRATITYMCRYCGLITKSSL